jgi:predicted nucleic acid-binding protein
METEGLGKVLVDTSVWIDFFRKKEPYYTSVLALIDGDSIVCVDMIFAELLQGAQSKKEFNTIKEFLYIFDFLAESEKVWELAGTTSFKLQRKGKPVGLSDCYIAAFCKVHNVKLFTKDKHLSIVQKKLNIDCFKIKK